jgi:hypothetical protein
MSQELLESRWGETKEALLEGLNGYQAQQHECYP